MKKNEKNVKKWKKKKKKWKKRKKRQKKKLIERNLQRSSITLSILWPIFFFFKFSIRFVISLNFSNIIWFNYSFFFKFFSILYNKQEIKLKYL